MRLGLAERKAFCKVDGVPERSRPALLLSSSPLVLVLAQVRFSAVLAMEEYVPEIQQRLRGRGFPRYEQEVIQAIDLIGPRPAQRSLLQWRFRSRDATSEVMLTPEFVLVQTNHYGQFEDFIGMVRAVTQAVQETTAVELVERLGLRYVDAIIPEAGESLSKYLKQGLLGLTDKELGVVERLHRFEILGQTTTGSRVLVRVLQTNDGTFVPPDLADNTLEYTMSVPPENVVTILDIDHFVTETFDFSPATIEERLWYLHDTNDLAFRSAVTEDALETWGAKGGQ